MAQANPEAGMTARPTIREIATRAGVSIATVSRVVNGHPHVSSDTRERVLHFVREGGFVGNRHPHATLEPARQTGLIGLVVPFMHAAYFAEIVEGASEFLEERDARFVVSPTHHRHDREVSMLHRVMYGTTDGAILILPSETSEELTRVRDEGFPFVVVDPSLPIAGDFPIVSAANWSGARSAVEHLIALGHTRIAAITGAPEWCASRDRLAGYQAALLAHGLSASADLVYESDFLLDGGYRAAQQILALPHRPTAIFAFNDNMAVGVLRAARERGLVVPRDLSVVGYDDVEMASIVTPELTTVRQPLSEMGRVAASLLFRLIDGGSVEAARLELSTTLVVRESTGPFVS